MRWTRHAGHCWRSGDKLISDVLLWTPTYGWAKAGWPARTYIQQLCEDTGCSPEDLPEAMNDREKWRERVRDISATSTTWWWWFWDSFEWVYFQISNDAKYFFLSCPRHCVQGLIVVIAYFFQIWNKREHNIMISRVISSHIGPMYIETPYINGLHLFWDSFEWFCLQISNDAKYFFLPCPRHCNRWSIVAIVYYFQIWNKKEHNIISSRLISSQMGPLYIETPYTTLYIENPIYSLWWYSTLPNKHIHCYIFLFILFMNSSIICSFSIFVKVIQKFCRWFPSGCFSSCSLMLYGFIHVEEWMKMHTGKWSVVKFWKQSVGICHKQHHLLSLSFFSHVYKHRLPSLQIILLS